MSQTLTLPQALQVAVQHHQAGDLQQAQTIYQQVLQVQPDNSDALHLLGLIALQLQNYDEAIDLIQQAIRINNTVPNYYNSLGNAFREQNQLTDATANYQRAVALDPQFAEAYNNLGLALKQSGSLTQAADYFQRALTLNPSLATAYRNWGEVLKEQQQLPAAINYLQRALSLAPQDAVTHSLLGDIFLEQNRLDEAFACYQQAVTFNPNLVMVHYNLGIILMRQGTPAEAAKSYQRAIELNPNFAEAYNNLGSVFKSQNQLTQATSSYRRAIELNPNFAEAYNNLGNVFKSQNQLTEAVACYQRAVAVNPNLVEAHNNLGVVFTEQNQLSEAQVCFQRILTLTLNSNLIGETYANLGLVLMEKGMIQMAIEHLKRALQLKPTETNFHTVLLWTLNYSTDHSPTTIFLEHQQFNEQYAKPLAITLKPHLNNRQVQRRLKIGYVSPDFRQHSVAFFIEPILAHHNHQEFEIYCYYNHTHIDEVTHRLQPYSDHWRECALQSDEELANLIRQEPIDILVDLAGHTGNNRLLVFARKPAPVQVTYLGYPNTTGLTAIDYRLSDHYIDTVGVNEQFTAELPIKLPTGFYCYQPHENSPVVNNLPAFDKGYITFSSFNHYAKVSSPILEVWAEILCTLPSARLVVQTKNLKDTGTRQSFLERLTRLGVTEEQVIITDFMPSPKYLETYHQIDLAFDTYPFNGGTTTCEALWMGVPVVTLVGTRPVSRLGLSILSILGLTELIAATKTEYVNICLKLANNLEYLQHLRATLRQRMQASPLMDAPSFTRQLETLYRELWEKWCK
jgi:predicted O-linked N-acetylglucosamine transferase (SPINDLY family)